MSNLATPRGTSAHRLTTAVLVLAAISVLGVYFYFAASNPFSGSYSDSVRYLFMADSFSGVSDPLTVLMAQESMFPPLFPLLLSAFGAGTDSITTAHIVTAVSLATACATMFWWLAEQRLTLNERLIAVLLLLLLPGFFIFSLVILSEFLFLTLVLGSLAALKKSESSGRWIYAAALMVGLSIVTRTVGIALLPSLFLACRALGFRKHAFAAILALSPVICWQLLRESTFESISYLELFMRYFDQVTFSQFIHNAGLQLRLLWRNWMLIFDSNLALHVAWAQSVLLAVSGIVFLTRLVRLKSESVFLAAYLGIIMFWPFPYELGRFALICLPIFLFYCLLAVNHVLAKDGLQAAGGLLRPVFVAIFLITILPSLLVLQHRFVLKADEEIRDYRFTEFWYQNLSDSMVILETLKLNRMYEMARAIGDHIAEDECVYATSGDFVSMYSGRRGVNLPRDMYDPLDSGEAYDITQLDQCNYVLMVGLPIRQVPQYSSMYPINALKGRLTPVLLSNLTYEDTEYTAAAFAKLIRKPASGVSIRKP